MKRNYFLELLLQVVEMLRQDIEMEVNLDLLLMFRSVAVEELRIEMQKNTELIKATKAKQASEVFHFCFAFHLQPTCFILDAVFFVF